MHAVHALWLASHPDGTVRMPRRGLGDGRRPRMALPAWPSIREQLGMTGVADTAVLDSFATSRRKAD